MSVLAKSVVWTAALLFLTACGGNGNGGEAEKTPTVPHAKDASKIPPALPQID